MKTRRQLTRKEEPMCIVALLVSDAKESSRQQSVSAQKRAGSDLPYCHMRILHVHKWVEGAPRGCRS